MSASALKDVPMTGEWYTINEVIELLRERHKDQHLREWHVNRVVRKNDIKTRRAGQYRMFSEEEIAVLEAGLIESGYLPHRRKQT